MSCFCICKRISPRHEVRGFDWDSGNLSKCPGHGVSLDQIEALFAGDVYVVRDTIASGERRILGFGNGAGRWIFLRLHLAREQNPAVSVRFMHEKEVKLYVEEISRLEKR
jgi:uncharacterized protein